MAIYTIIDNRDIDNQNQSWLSSVVSLSSFYQNLSGIISGDYLDDTILKRMEWMDLSSLTKISSDLSVLLKDEHLSSMVTLSADLDEKLRTIHLNQMTQVDSDVYSKIGTYLAQHGYVPGGGGSGSITYKYWRGITIPPHPTDSSKKDMSLATVVLENSTFSYTGSAIVPVVSYVRHSGQTLTNGTDYTVSIPTSIECDTYNVTVTGMGDYEGTKTASYQIVGTSIQNANVTLQYETAEFTGNTINPPVSSIKIGETQLVAGTDYEAQYPSSVNAGPYQVTIVGKGNYSGTQTKNYIIQQANITQFSELAYTEQERYKYTGNEIRPDVYWESGVPSFFRKGTEYTVEYRNNTNVGDATIVVSGIGNYKNSFEFTFEIYEEDLSYLELAAATISWEPEEFTYSGNQCTPTVTVVDKNGTTLTKDTHYTVTYGTNVNAGTGLIYIKAIAPYKTTGVEYLTKEFTINPATITCSATDGTGNVFDGGKISVSNVSPSSATVQYSLDNSSFSSTNPTVTGKAGDYTVYFKITKDNYETLTGSKKVTLSAVNMTQCTATINPESYSLTGDEASITTTGSQTPTVTLKYGSKTLTLNTHYTVAYSGHKATIQTGGSTTAKVTISGKTNYITGDDKSINYTISYTQNVNQYGVHACIWDPSKNEYVDDDQSPSHIGWIWIADDNSTATCYASLIPDFINYIWEHTKTGADYAGGNWKFYCRLSKSEYEIAGWSSLKYSSLGDTLSPDSGTEGLLWYKDGYVNHANVYLKAK